MGAIKTVFDACMSILSIDIYLLGYHVNMWQVLLFSVVAYLLLWFIFRILR